MVRDGGVGLLLGNGFLGRMLFTLSLPLRYTCLQLTLDRDPVGVDGKILKLDQRLPLPHLLSRFHQNTSDLTG